MLDPRKGLVCLKTSHTARIYMGDRFNRSGQTCAIKLTGIHSVNVFTGLCSVLQGLGVCKGRVEPQDGLGKVHSSLAHTIRASAQNS